MDNFNITEWVDEFFSYTENENNYELDPKLYVTVSSVVMMELANQIIPEQITNSFSFKVIKSRAELVGLKCSDYFCLILSAVCDTPGNAVMWVSAFRHLQDADEAVPGQKPVYDANHFFQVTQLKIPTTQYLQKMWDAQKNRDHSFRVDNWLDVIATEEAFIDATRKGYVEQRVVN